MDLRIFDVGVLPDLRRNRRAKLRNGGDIVEIVDIHNSRE